MPYRSLRFCALLAALFIAPVSASANQLLNFSFETPDVPVDPGFRIVNAGDSAITGWTVSKNGVDLIGPVYAPITGPAYHGLNFLDMDGTPGPGAISQELSTISGKDYALFFAYSNNAEVGGNPGLTVSISNTNLLPVTVYHADAVDGDLNWLTASFTFTASSTSATLLFESTSPEGNMGGILLDAVSISEFTRTGIPGSVNPNSAAIPEPASLTLLGLGALVLLRRRN